MNNRPKIFPLLAMLLGFFIVFQLVFKNMEEHKPETTYSQLVEMINTKPKSVRKIVFLNGQNTVEIEREGQSQPELVQVPDQGGKEELIKKANDAKVPVSAQDAQGGFGSFLLRALFEFGPVLLLVYFFFMRPGMGMGSGAGGTTFNPMQLTRSGARRGTNNNTRKTFADVAGCDEAIKKLKRITNFHRKRRVFELFGARIPKGILLVGPSGTGKTLLAKAVAGELDGEFFSISGSDFVEMFVGVGASRVRSLFQEAKGEAAKTKKPVVIFVDEIDAVGGKRSSGLGGNAHGEREQTLNQLLVCMDGVEENSDVVVMAATNRSDVLDPALTRPGRFDYHVLVDLPDVTGREAIFRLHTAGKKLDRDVDTKILAQRTYGYSGADIESVCNEASILAGERADEEIGAKLAITLSDFDEAIDSVKLGEARTSRLKGMSDKDRLNTTVHEVGHAWISSILPDGNPVVKVTNVPRERALGYTQAMPEADQYSYTNRQAVARVMMAMAGRAAQEVFLGTVDTGASNDFEQATSLTRKMVTQWGMSRLGHICVGEPSEGAFLGMAQAAAGFGPHLADDIDRAWMELNEACYRAAKEIIERDRRSIQAIVERLTAKETILAVEWKQLLAENQPCSTPHVRVPTADNPTQGDAYPPPPSPEDGGNAATCSQVSPVE